MKFKSTLAALGAAATIGMGAGAAQADGHTKYAEPQHYGWQWYVELLAGGPLPNDYDSVLTGTTALGPVEYDPDMGFGVVGLVGVQFDPNWRADISISYATAGDGIATGPAIAGGAPHSGDVDAYTFLANVYYEFTQFTDLPITPWIGVGIGFTSFDYDNLGAIGGAFTINDSDTAFTGALHVGFDWELTPAVDLVGRYALILNDDHTVTGTDGTIISADSTVDNALYGGIRIKFNALR